jgi:protein-disulfide isomerase
MRRNPLVALLLMLGLSACSSTMPNTTAQRSAATQATAVPAATAAATAVVSDGPMTASMATLQIGGERYATLGDPAAPITLVEYSDFG